MTQKFPSVVRGDFLVAMSFLNILQRTGMFFNEAFEKVLTWTMENYPSPPLADGYAKDTIEKLAYRFTNQVATLDDLLFVCQALGMTCDISIVIPEPSKKKTYPEAYWDMKIDELDIPVRATNVLKADLKYYIGDVVQLKYNDLLKIPNLGRVSANRIRDAVTNFGLKLDTNTGDWKAPTRN